MSSPLERYERRRLGPVGDRQQGYDVYVAGHGPPVIIMQEAPGIGAEALRFADALKKAGFQVWMPHLFGPLGRTATVLNLARVWCMRREFALLARDRSSPVVDWMRALCRSVKDETGASGVGVVGMCLTGNFALTLIADDAVLAAVAAQPSLPVDPDGLHMSAAEISASRAAIDKKGPALAYRFACDRSCGPARFEAIARAFNDDATRVHFRVLPGKGHSVFTLDLSSDSASADALAEVIGYLHAALGGARGAARGDERGDERGTERVYAHIPRPPSETPAARMAEPID